MFIIDYWVYKIYSITHKYFYHGIAYMTFMLLFVCNVDNILMLMGYPLWEEKYRYVDAFFFFAFTALLFYVYESKKRLKKVINKYKNENNFWRIFGWILIGVYVFVTGYLLMYPKK